MFKKLLFTAILATGLTGCATVNHTPLSQEKSMELTEKTIVNANYPKADFSAFTAGKAALGPIGAAAMISEGNEITEQNEIPDPAVAIANKLSDNLVKARQMKQVLNSNIATEDNVSNLLKSFSGADYVLDVKTVNWMFNYYSSDWSHYKVTYTARLRLIESASEKVVAETLCTTVQGDDENPPTQEQLLENKASLLKNYLDKGVDQCVNLLSEQVFMLKTTN